MNILHITPAHYPAMCYGGPIFTVWQMNNALAKFPGVLLRVLTTDAAGARRLSGQERAIRPDYELVFTRRIAGAGVSPGLLTRLLPALAWADVVHLTALYSFPTIPVLMACRVMAKPTVWSLRGALLDDLNRAHYDPQSSSIRFIKHCWNRLCRSLIERPGAAIHVTTHQELEASRSVFHKARFALIPNGVEIPNVLPENREWLAGGQVRLMFLGRLAPKKGIENLLHAMAQLGPQVYLKLYGSGHVAYARKLRALAENLRVGDRTVFMGHLDGETKPRAFFEADVCVVPSYSENFCIVVAEALAHGVPVIVSDRLAWGEVAEVACGLVVPNDPESLAAAVRRIAGMDLPEMGHRGRRWMQKSFDWAVIAKRMAITYKSVVEATRES